jgi:hypothetical protein
MKALNEYQRNTKKKIRRGYFEDLYENTIIYMPQEKLSKEWRIYLKEKDYVEQYKPYQVLHKLVVGGLQMIYFA